MEKQIGIYEMFNHFNNQTLDIYLCDKSNNYFNTEDGSYIYFLLNNDNIVYIGKTKNSLSRIGQHINNKKFNGFVWFNVNELDIDIIENFLIEVYEPIYNKSKSLIHRIFLRHLNLLSDNIEEQMYNLENDIKDKTNRHLSPCEKINKLNQFITLFNLSKYKNTQDNKWLFYKKTIKTENGYFIDTK